MSKTFAVEGVSAFRIILARAIMKYEINVSVHKLLNFCMHTDTEIALRPFFGVLRCINCIEVIF